MINIINIYIYIYIYTIVKQGVEPATQKKRGKLVRQTLHMRKAPFTDKALEPKWSMARHYT